MPPSGLPACRRSVPPTRGGLLTFIVPLAPTTDLGHPAPGHVRFLARRADGVRAAAASEEELESGTHPLSPLYLAGQEVITQLRLVTEAR